LACCKATLRRRKSVEINLVGGGFPTPDNPVYAFFEPQATPFAAEGREKSSISFFQLASAAAATALAAAALAAAALAAARVINAKETRLLAPSKDVGKHGARSAP
jgi:hypothetical protein